MKKAKKEMTFCDSQLIDDTKALQLEFCAISAMIGCNITNERLGQSSLLQFDEHDLKLVGAYVIYLIFCQATGQDLEDEFALSPQARLLFDDVESNMSTSSPSTQDKGNEDNSLLNQELAKLFQVCFACKKFLILTVMFLACHWV